MGTELLRLKTVSGVKVLLGKGTSHYQKTRYIYLSSFKLIFQIAAEHFSYKICEACLLHCTEEFVKIVLAQSTSCGPCVCDSLEVVKAFDLGMILRVWGSSKASAGTGCGDVAMDLK